MSLSLKLESKCNELSDTQKDSVFILTVLSDNKKFPKVLFRYYYKYIIETNFIQKFSDNSDPVKQSCTKFQFLIEVKILYLNTFMFYNLCD